MAKTKYTFDYVKKYIENRGLILLEEEYVNNHEKMSVVCTCGNRDWKVNFKDIQRGHKCKKCGSINGGIKQSLGINKVREIFKNNGYELKTEDYKNNESDLIAIHKDCGLEFKTTYAAFRDGKRCNCGVERRGKNRTKPLSSIISNLNSHGFELYEGTYENNSTPISIQDKDGYKYFVKYAVFYSTVMVRKQKLERFSVINKYTIENIKLWIEIENLPFEFISGSYDGNNRSSLILRCKKCSKEFDVTWANLYQDRSCTRCTKSIGENAIHDFLDSYKNVITFIPQYSFPDCKYKKALLFDFAIFDENDVLVGVCEYQGIQHTMEIDFAGYGDEFAKKLYKENLIKDQIKREYCAKNNIKLIEISYLDFDRIPEILSSELNLN